MKKIIEKIIYRINDNFEHTITSWFDKELQLRILDELLPVAETNDQLIKELVEEVKHKCLFCNTDKSGKNDIRICKGCVTSRLIERAKEMIDEK